MLRPYEELCQEEGPFYNFESGRTLSSEPAKLSSMEDHSLFNITIIDFHTKGSDPGSELRFVTRSAFQIFCICEFLVLFPSAHKIKR